MNRDKILNDSNTMIRLKNERKRIGSSSIQRITLYGSKFCAFRNNLIHSIGFCAKDHQDADKSSEMCYIGRALGDKTSNS